MTGVRHLVTINSFNNFTSSCGQQFRAPRGIGRKFTIKAEFYQHSWLRSFTSARNYYKPHKEVIKFNFSTRKDNIVALVF